MKNELYKIFNILKILSSDEGSLILVFFFLAYMVFWRKKNLKSISAETVGLKFAYIFWI